MPSPLGHALAAVAVQAAVSPRLVPFLEPRSVGIVVAAALAPDLDLLWRFVDGRNHHQAETHSVGAAALAGIAVWALARLRRWRPAAGLGLLATLGWLSHLLLDYLGRDTHPPIGLLLFWPFSTGWFKSPWPLFLDIGRTLLAWETLQNNALAVGWEIALLLPPTVWIVWRRFQEH